MSAWPSTSLADIFDIARGGSPRPIDDFITQDSDGIPWIMIGDAREGSKYITSTRKKIRPTGVRSSRLVKPGDFLLTNSMSFGHPYILKTSGCIHDGWLVLSPRGSHVDPDYFYHLLGSAQLYSEFSRVAAGATVKNLNIELVSGVRVPLPSPAEQHRIAAILDEADALRAKRRIALAKLDELAEAMFASAFGDVILNSRGWPSDTTLGQVAEIVSGVTKGRKLNGKPTRQVPYLAVANVQDRSLSLRNVKMIEATDAEIAGYRLQRDDLLLTEGGDPDKLGRGCLWSEELPECIHQNHVFRVRIHDRRVLPVFLNWLVGSKRGKKYFLRAAKQTTGIASINMTQLRNFPLLLPPRSVQEAFAKRIAAVESLRSTHRAALAEHDALFASLQHRAFRGELFT